MVSEFQSCKQCGIEKPIDQFREYYNGRKGNYKVCKDCEKVNSRRKYLEGKSPDSCSEEERQELQDIYTLYDMQRSLGFKPPRARGKNEDVSKILQEQLVQYQKLLGANSPEELSEIVPDSNSPVPADILTWLNTPICDLVEVPDYYYRIHDELVDKYNPITHIDPDSMKAVRKQTYKEELSKILMMFDSYDDNYTWED